MSTAGEIVQTVLDVAVAGDNWANLAFRPSVCLIGKDRTDQVKPKKTVFIKEAEGGHENTVNRVAIFTKDYCTLRAVMANHDDRENAFADIKVMFQNSSNAITIRGYSREDRMDLFIMVIRVEVSNI